MGFFDRFTSSKPTPVPASSAPAPAAAASPVAGGVMPRLAEARAKLEGKDLPAAMAIYEDVLASAGARPDVLVTISGDLGVHGHMAPLIELIAPRYDAEKHGPATGMNLLQAYLVARQPESAQHVLDLLFALNRPDLEERLLGFSNALAEVMAGQEHELAYETPAATKVSLSTISKPMWFYGLEEVAPALLPERGSPPRRVAFTQLSLPGLADFAERQTKPEDETGRFCRGVALWLSESFHCSEGYDPVAAVAVTDKGHYAILPFDWSAENLRELAEGNKSGFHYIVTGSLRVKNADYELGLRIWEVKKFRQLKAFAYRWTPATADETLRQMHEQLRAYMEWKAPTSGLPYVAPASPAAHVQALGSSLTLFLGEKNVLSAEQLPADATVLLAGARANPDDPRAQLALVNGVRRLQARGAAVAAEAVAHARDWLASPAAASAGVAGLTV